MRRVRTVLFCLTAGAMIWGCAGGAKGVKFNPESSGAYAAKDGTVYSALVEAYNADYYDEDSLKAFLEEKVASYNSAKTGGAAVEGEEERPAKLLSCTVTEGTMKAVFQFATAKDMAQFARENNDGFTQFESMEVTEARDGVPDAAFIKAADQKAAGSDEISKEKGLYLVSVKGSGRILTEGKVMYVTEGVTVEGDSRVTTPEGDSYILFK